MSSKSIFVVSLGGSVLVPSSVDVNFLREFKGLIEKLVKEGSKFIIICGGGRICRDYQNAAKAVSEISKDDLDWIGVHATRLNAQLLRDVLSKVANRTVIHEPKKVSFREGVLVAAGWKPGWSTDYIAAQLARKNGISTIINITSRPYVYDRDPEKFGNARPIRKISWSEFRKMFGNEWSPGLNVPFDPVASRDAHSAGIKVVAVGKDLKNLENFLRGKAFSGTVIE